MRRLEPQREDRSARWVLASASPRRAELLRGAGQRFEVEPSRVDEARRSGEGALDFAGRVAREKATEIAARRPGWWILAADTIVIVDGDPLGKPIDADDAVRMLVRLSGHVHEVATAFVLLDPEARVFVDRTVRTEVLFGSLERTAIDAYVATGEPLDKAGAYAIQGGARSFVADLRGSLSNVIGLPMAEVEQALRSAGLWTDTVPDPVR